MGLSINEIAQSYEGGDIVPIYTAEQLEKVGTGETAYVAETGKIYTFEDDKSYLFYGQSEDLTKILNDLIDERLGTSSGTTTGTKTLLWEREIPRNDNADEIIAEEREIEVKNLSEYKQLIIEIEIGITNRNMETDIDTKMIEHEYLDIEYMKENNENYITPSYTGLGASVAIKYINENTLNIVDPSETRMMNVTYRIYGIE